MGEVKKYIFLSSHGIDDSQLWMDDVERSAAKVCKAFFFEKITSANLPISDPRQQGCCVMKTYRPIGQVDTLTMLSIT